MSREHEIREIKRSVINQLRLDLSREITMDDAEEYICDTADILRLYNEELKQIKTETNAHIKR